MFELSQVAYVKQLFVINVAFSKVALKQAVRDLVLVKC